MQNRRAWLGQVAGGAAVAALAGYLPSGTVLGANDRIRIGLIGAGGRGKEIFRAALKCPNVEAVAVADIYTRRLDEAKAIAPGIATYSDFRRLLDDKSIDAVLIATPQHQHALNFVPAIEAGKDVYQEKTMAFNPDHAKRMRKALNGSGRVVQVGMQMNSGSGVRQIKDLLSADKMGTLTAIEAHHYRNSAYGGWMRQIPEDCDPRNVAWQAFEGEAKHYSFDPDRYINWRFYWDYSGGNVFENMVHNVAFWHQALGLTIPQTVTMSGANFRSPKMEVPDTMAVTMNHAENIVYTWNSIFSNSFFGEKHDHVFGTKGTVLHDSSDRAVYIPQGKKPEFENDPAAVKTNPEGGDLTLVHMQNFFDCVRSRQEPNCPFEIGFRTAIACQMAITSYRRQRTVRWDPQAEDIV